MANLRVDKITSTETFETTGSVQFDGSGDYLTAPDSSGLLSLPGSFTIELFVSLSDVTGNVTFVCKTNNGSQYAWFLQYIPGSGGIRFYPGTGSGTGTLIIFDWSPNTGTWYHLALTRDASNNVRMFVDGLQIGRTAVNTDTLSSTGQITIGDNIDASGTQELNGYISNLRVIKGTALYTSNFKPSMRELEVTAETVLLACQSKTDATLEKTGKTITANGNAVASELTPGILTPVVKSGGGSAITGSVEFDGTGDYLSIANNTDFNFGTGDFTVECFIYVNKHLAGGTDVIVSTYQDSSNGWTLGIHGSSPTDKFYFGIAGDSSQLNSSVLYTNSWVHLAAARSGSTAKLFINGVEAASASNSTNQTSTSDLHIGTNVGGGALSTEGFISNLRVVKGTALYTADFIPPTRELKRVPGTVLLCCQDPNNPLTEVTGKTITPYGSLGDGGLGQELVTNDSVWTLTKGGSGATDWTVSNAGRSLAGTTVSGGYIRATYTLDKGDYLVSLRWTGGAFAVQDSTGYITTTSGIDTEFSASEDGAYSFYMSDTTSVVITGTSWSTAYTVDDISIKRIYKNNGGSNFTPQVGDDRQVTFEGVTKINSDAYFYLPTGDTASRETTGTYNAGTRGIFGAIQVYPTAGDSIHYATIASFGNTVDFGDLVVAKRYGAGCSSKTRGIFGGGSDTAPSPNNNQSSMSYITIASTGNSLNFGNLTTARWGLSAFSNATRGIFFSGNTSPANTNVIDYVTIASTGNAQDFGDAFSARRYPLGSTSDTTRGIDAGGHDTSDNVIQYVTIASTGNAQDFGDLMQGIDGGCGGVSNGTRGVFAGGYTPTQVNTIQYITIQSMGNSKDFGDMTSTDARHGAAAESSIRGLFTHGGYPSRLNTIDAITIATTGNAVEFGDIIDIGGNDGGGDSGTQSGFSNGHGGLG